MLGYDCNQYGRVSMDRCETYRVIEIVELSKSSGCTNYDNLDHGVTYIYMYDTRTHCIDFWGELKYILIR